MSRSQPRPAQPSLEAMTDAVRSPDATRADTDLLIAALRRAPTEEETPRARADLLLGLLAPDHPLGDRAGREGVTVRQAAKDALLDLGHPYALELPPEVLAREARRRTRLGGFGVAVATASMLYQSGLFYAFLLHDGVVHNQHSSHRPPEQLTRDRVVPWALFTLSGLLPALVSLGGHALKRRWLQNTGWSLILAQALLWTGVVCLSMTKIGPSGFTALAPWHVAWLSAWIMRPTR
ncbi:hypothetical protein HI113_22220 [Corallococcus exiguus]|uniref:hypothetical protein n=1 Tax=Corallococcus TaxID=83461 RepID=UPI0011C489D8|nr:MULTISPECIES: hypothetical protein [Corallococcus]NNB96618.1 hypothetical protein [Corallococcus exiguus]NPC49363.1 hypothetical protein [Corallococcus exiguus]